MYNQQNLVGNRDAEALLIGDFSSVEVLEDS